LRAQRRLDHYPVMTPLARFVAALAALLAGLACADSKPNIVFILADDLGWNAVSFHGGEIRTPNIDRLAADGARLEAFYAQPVCTPTRAALLTGRYPIRYGLHVGLVRPWSQFGLPLDERTLAQALTDVGYETAIFGKWHLGHHQRAYLPTQRGFQHQYGQYNGAIDYFSHVRDGSLDWHRDDQVNHDPGYSTTLIGNEAVRLIESHDFATPLFLYLPFSAPHTPLQALPEHLSLYAGIPDVNRRTYAAMVHAMDEQIGRVVAAIEKRGVTKKTLFIVASDNGAPRYLTGMNGELRGGKGTLYEGGVRVVALAKWTGQIAPGTVVDEPLHMVDWYPTLLKLAGASLEQPLALDGRDAWATIAQGAPAPHDAILLNAAPRGGAIRAGSWKLVVARQPRRAGGGARVELFDLAKDPTEKDDLAATHPEKVAELGARLDALTSEAMPRKTSPMPEGFHPPAVWGEAE